MGKLSKKFAAAKARVESREYELESALGLVKEISFAKFDESVEIAMVLGVNPRHADQMVRGTIVLPHGTGKSKRVVVIAGGEKVKEAEEAGADMAGGADIVAKIQEGWLDFEAVIATPDQMREVGKLGKILGPRGLMPNAKTGTVTMDVAQAISDIKAGKVEFRVDKNGIIHCSVGRCSFSLDKLLDNSRALLGAVLRAKPTTAKGKYVRRVHISSTMGPGVEIDLKSVEAAA